jgi:ABC-2 type transport system permease protein
MSSPVPEAAPTGRIHDIGYRHYDGPRLGRAYIGRSLYINNVRCIYGLGRPAKSKIIPFLLAGFMFVPAAASVAAHAISNKITLIPYGNYAMDLQPLIAIFLAAQSPIVASRELRTHTVPLYFSRPVSFFDYVLAKFGALVTAMFLLVALPLLLLYLGSLLTKDPDPGYQLGHFLLSLVGGAILALVLAAIGFLLAAYAPRRGFGIVAVMAVYLVSSALVGTMQSLAFSKGHYTLEGWLGLFTPFSLVQMVEVNLLQANQVMRLGYAGVLGGFVALALSGLTVACSLGLLYLRFRKAGR